jgi:hypothetical protein
VLENLNKESAVITALDRNNAALTGLRQSITERSHSIAEVNLRTTQYAYVYKRTRENLVIAKERNDVYTGHIKRMDRRLANVEELT